MIAFCKYVKGINTWGKRKRAVRLKDNIGTGTNACKLSEEIKLEMRRKSQNQLSLLVVVLGSKNKVCFKLDLS